MQKKLIPVVLAAGLLHVVPAQAQTASISTTQSFSNYDYVNNQFALFDPKLGPLLAVFGFATVRETYDAGSNNPNIVGGAGTATFKGQVYISANGLTAAPTAYTSTASFSSFGFPQSLPITAYGAFSVSGDALSTFVMSATNTAPKFFGAYISVDSATASTDKGGSSLFLYSSPRGGPSVFDTLTLTYVYGVPEPATWGMMILGVGAIGVAMRRRPITMRLRMGGDLGGRSKAL